MRLMYHRKTLGCLAILGVLSAFALLYSSNSLLGEARTLYCEKRCDLLSEVREWVRRFGKPQELPDEELEGFLYWPADGMGVLAGYLYEAQGRRVEDLMDRRVTSILIPCRKVVSLSAFDIYAEGFLEFSSTPVEKFPDSKLARACRGRYRSLFLFSGQIDSDEVWLSNMPHYLLGRSAVIVHLVDGRPGVIEILESNIFSWYD